MIAAETRREHCVCRLSKSGSVCVLCRVLPPLLTTMQRDGAEARLTKRQLEQKINLLDRLATCTKTGAEPQQLQVAKIPETVRE
jgi:hypothetical protein